MTPIEQLTQTLKEHQRALQKSHQCYERDEITPEVYATHVGNLERLIKEYKEAIETLVNKNH